MAEPRAERPRDGSKSALDAGVVAYLGEAWRMNSFLAAQTRDFQPLRRRQLLAGLRTLLVSRRPSSAPLTHRKLVSKRFSRTAAPAKH